MWNRSMLKQNAKSVLSQSYWKSFFVCIIVGMLTGGGGVAYTTRFKDWSPYLKNLEPTVVFPLICAALGVTAISFFTSTAFSIFVSGPFEVGAGRYFLESTQMRFQLDNVVYGFRCGKYLNVAVTIFVRNLFNGLWYLLFIIPGIVKGYAYALVPYILAENPALSPTQAIDISCRMTKNQKWDMFVLDLSFLGWYLLGALAFGIGVIFVTPYYEATRAQLYLALRTYAIDSQAVSLDELTYIN